MSVINIEKKVIFVHIPKCAGTSMNFVLGGRGHKDIHELMEFASNHICANGDKFLEYFKFAFVRHPIDVVAALFSNGNEDVDKFRTLLRTSNPLLTIRSQYSYIYDAEGNLQVDFVGRYENLQEDWKYVCSKFGGHIPLPWIRTGIGRFEKPYIQYYDKKSEETVREYFRKDFELFGYE